MLREKIIKNIDISLHGFIQGCEKGSILSHKMSAYIINYPFILHKMRNKFDLEGEIISRSMNN
jgi:hypothetical protein